VRQVIAIVNHKGGVGKNILTLIFSSGTFAETRVPEILSLVSHTGREW
jgi:MinD-like ATPase involved in chromosome partitioning or flagellar assembly